MKNTFTIIVLFVIICIRSIISQEIWTPVHPIGVDNPVLVNDSVLLSGVKSSVDGINWTIGQPDTFMVLNSTAGVCSNQYYYYAASYNGYIWYSSDLKKWSYRKVFDNKKIKKMIMHNNRFYMIVIDNSEKYLYSGKSTSDLDSIAPLPNNATSLFWCGEKLYAIGDSKTYSSSDSVNWIEETKNSFVSIVNTPICNIGLKASTTIAIAAGDTDLWSDVNVDAISSDVILDVDYYNSKLLAITASQSYISSDTGKTWQKLSEQVDHPKLKDLYHIRKQGDIESTLFATGSQTGGVIFSFNSDNNEWVNVAEGMKDTLKTIHGFAINDSIIIGVSYNGVIITSNDSGETWESTKFTNHFMYSYPVFFKDSFYVLSKINGVELTTDTNVILTSSNGIDWNIKELNADHNFNALGVHQNKLVAGARGKIWISDDGIAWEEINVPNGDGDGLWPDIESIASNGKTLACIYDHTGKVIYSNDLEVWNTSITHASDLGVYPDIITSNGTNFVAASGADHQTSTLDSIGWWTEYPYDGADYGIHFRIGNEYAATWHYIFTYSNDGEGSRKKYSAPYYSPRAFCYMGNRLIVGSYDGIFTSENVNGAVDPVSVKPTSLNKHTLNKLLIKKGVLISNQTPVKKVIIYAINGKILYRNSYENANKIKLPKLASGVYKINVIFKDNSFRVVSYLNIK